MDFYLLLKRRVKILLKMGLKNTVENVLIMPSNPLQMQSNQLQKEQFNAQQK